MARHDGVQPFQYAFPTRVVFGAGVLATLPSLVEEVAGPGARVFLVTGQRSLRAQGVLDRVLDGLGRQRVVAWDGVRPFPPPAAVDQALEACRRQGCQVVVAIGGGSPLDVGKLVAALAPHPGPSLPYLSGQAVLRRRGLPFVAVPTTSGSSSEVTPFTSLWDLERKEKWGLAHPFLYPTVALVDPALALSMSPSLAAATGMDALTSAFEAYWSRNASPVSDALVLAAIRLYLVHLEPSCAQGDAEARAACALASVLSGMGYSNARTTLCHALSQPLTLHFGATHGMAVGITLPSLLRWNAPTLGPRLIPLLDALGTASVEEGAARLEGLLQGCGLPTRLRELGVAQGDLERIAREGVGAPQAANNPRPMSAAEAQALLAAIW